MSRINPAFAAQVTKIAGAVDRLDYFQLLRVDYDSTNFDEETVGSLDDNLFASDTELSIDSAFGWVAQVGLDYQINDNWLISAAVYYIDLETDAELKITDTALLGGDAILKTSAELNPMIYFLSIGYQF